MEERNRRAEATRLRRLRQPVGERVEELKLIHFAQVDIRGVIQHETPHVSLANQVNVAVLLLAACGSAQGGLQPPGVDPAGYSMGIDSKGLRQTVGRIEFPAFLESHTLQLQMNRRRGSRVSGSLELQAQPLVAHPGEARKEFQLRLTPRQLLGACQS